MNYECDNDNHDIGCQCPGIVYSRSRRERVELVTRILDETIPESVRVNINGLAERIVHELGEQIAT